MILIKLGFVFTHDKNRETGPTDFQDSGSIDNKSVFTDERKSQK